MNVHVSIIRLHCSKGTRRALFAFVDKMSMFNPMLKIDSHTRHSQREQVYLTHT